MEYGELKKLWQCNDKIAEENFMRLKELELDTHLTPAVLSYEGIQYQYMAPQVFSERQWAYVKEHLRILSGLYGVLKPMDGVIPYRLEMQAKLRTGDAKDLYALERQDLQGAVERRGFYTEPGLKRIQQGSRKIRRQRNALCHLYLRELLDGKVKVKGTMAKMARGEMVRWLSEKNITELGKDQSV